MLNHWSRRGDEAAPSRLDHESQNTDHGDAKGGRGAASPEIIHDRRRARMLYRPGQDRFLTSIEVKGSNRGRCRTRIDRAEPRDRTERLRCRVNQTVLQYLAFDPARYDNSITGDEQEVKQSALCQNNQR